MAQDINYFVFKLLLYLCSGFSPGRNLGLVLLGSVEVYLVICSLFESADNKMNRVHTFLLCHFHEHYGNIKEWYLERRTFNEMVLE